MAKQRKKIDDQLKDSCDYISPQDKVDVSNALGFTRQQTQNVINQHSYNKDIEEALRPIAKNRVNEHYNKLKKLKRYHDNNA